ncbi:hypothetical protein [Ramlibacter sp. 2FC]|uniref:hypothetical protein n=1 Tax=Ramlibacter sp. 2FC TaxID=2502188 RepID=UPI0010F60B98|nr:hypothetical protein [Ramlibacter sp. 2FC]
MATLVIAALGALGGWAVVVAALTHYISDLFAKRTLQREAARFSERLADLGHELKLRESAYSKHLDLLLAYYSAFYRHYRICQNATNQDAHRHDDGTIVRTKETFWENLDRYREQMSSLEGTARLLLSASLLELHDEGIAAFNAFKDVMKRDLYDDKYHNDKREAFASIMGVKQRLETGLRTFLRTEHMLSPSEI